MKTFLTIIITAYLILLWDCKITHTNKNWVYKIKYNGLLWVALDYYTIIKYNSDDKPMKWIDCSRTKYITANAE